MLDFRIRYLQLAFNDDVGSALRVVPLLPKDERIIVEAGTPFVKREGASGIRALHMARPGHLVADIKTTDGGAEEVELVAAAGATAATVMGSCPTETIARFIAACTYHGMDSLIDMLGVSDPLEVMRELRVPPTGIVLHLGRDEESTRGKQIQYRHVTRVRSKYDVAISAAGGVDLHGARTAIFNGANIVVANIVAPGKPWQGIPADSDVPAMAQQFLDTIE
jgi:bifunctional enzyme Fae/Hps